MGPRLGCLAWASGRLYLIAWHRQQAGDPWPEAATGKAKTGDGTWWPLAWGCLPSCAVDGVSDWVHLPGSVDAGRAGWYELAPVNSQWAMWWL